MKKEIRFNENEYVLYRTLECLSNCLYGTFSSEVNSKLEELLKLLIKNFDKDYPKGYEIIDETYFRKTTFQIDTVSCCQSKKK